MSKSTKYFDLFSALKAGGEKGVSPESLQKTLKFTQGALAVYIHALRNKFGATIESIRSGRTVVAYKLTNASAMEKVITAERKQRDSKKPAKTSVIKKVSTITKKETKKVDGSIPVLDDLEVTELTDSDLADLKHSLGI